MHNAFLAGEARLKLFPFLGQSNADGRGLCSEWPPDLPINSERIWVYDWFGRWRHPATEPVGLGKATHPPRAIGPMMSFADRLASLRPAWNIGIVPCAVGGSRITRWQKPRKALGLYDVAVSRLAQAEAESGGKLAGVVCSQGEAESKDESDAVGHRELATRLIVDFRNDTSTVPWVWIDLGNVPPSLARRYAHWDTVRAGIFDIAVPHYATVSTADLPRDDVHWETAQQIEIGARAASAMSEQLDAIELLIDGTV